MWGGAVTQWQALALARPKLPPGTPTSFLTSSLSRSLQPPSVCTAVPCARLKIPEFVRAGSSGHAAGNINVTSVRPSQPLTQQAPALLVTPAAFPHSLALSSHMFLFSWFCPPSPPDYELLEGRGPFGFSQHGHNVSTQGTVAE